MGFLCGVGQVAFDLIHFPGFVHKGEGNDHLVSFLGNGFAIIDGLSVHTGRGTGLETAELQSRFFQGFRQVGGGRQPVGTAGFRTFTDEDLASQVGTGGQDDGLCPVFRADLRDDAHGFPVLHQEPDHFRLLQVQIFLGFHGLLHFRMVFLFIRLSPKGMDRRAFGGVQHGALDQGFIDIQTHFAPQGIDLPDQVAFAGAADGRVAGHHGY